MESGRFDRIHAKSFIEEKTNYIKPSLAQKKKKNKSLRNINPIEFDFDAYIASNQEDLVFRGSEELLKKIKKHDIKSMLNYLRVVSAHTDFSFEADFVITFVKFFFDDLIRYFRGKVILSNREGLEGFGDLKEIEFLYPFLSNTNQQGMQEVFKDFLDQSLVAPNDLFEKELAPIGDFFYEVSEVYRAENFKKNTERHVDLESISNSGGFTKNYSFL